MMLGFCWANSEQVAKHKMIIAFILFIFQNFIFSLKNPRINTKPLIIISPARVHLTKYSVLNKKNKKHLPEKLVDLLNKKTARN